MNRKFAMLLAWSWAALAPGQLSTGSIEGLIQDAEGKTVLGATVTVGEMATGRELALITNWAGRYSAGALMPGTYRVRIEAKGFQTVEILDLTVESGATLKGDATLTHTQRFSSTLVSIDGRHLAFTNPLLHTRPPMQTLSFIHLLANRCLFFFRLTEEEFFGKRPDASQAASQQRHGPAIARPKSVTK